MDPGKRLQLPEAPPRMALPGGGCGHTPGPWAQLPPVLCWGDKHLLSDQQWVLIRTQVTVLTQQLPSPGSTGVNFPTGKTDMKWDPSEDWFQGSSAPEVLGLLHLPVAAHV